MKVRLDNVIGDNFEGRMEYAIIAEDGRREVLNNPAEECDAALHFGYKGNNPCDQEDCTSPYCVIGRRSVREYLAKHVGESIDDPGYFGD